MDYAFVIGLGLAAGLISGVIGTGGSLLLLPALVLVYGAQAAVPIMAIASVMANAGRLAAWRCDVQWQPVLAFSLGGIPSAVLGANTLISLPGQVAELMLGCFLLLLIPLRRLLRRCDCAINLATLFVSSLVLGFLTGIVQSTGPLKVLLFTLFGLKRGALLGTEAAASLAVYLTKTTTFSWLGALDGRLLVEGAFVGSALIAGAYAGKALLPRIDDRYLGLIMEVVILISAMCILTTAWACTCDAPGPDTLRTERHCIFL